MDFGIDFILPIKVDLAKELTLKLMANDGERCLFLNNPEKIPEVFGNILRGVSDQIDKLVAASKSK